MCFYYISVTFGMNIYCSLFLINWACFKLFCTYIMCIIVGDWKTQVLEMESCYNRFVETTKYIGCRGIETSLEQWRYISCCYSNPRAKIDLISYAITKTLQSKVSKNRGNVPHTFSF